MDRKRKLEKFILKKRISKKNNRIRYVNDLILCNDKLIINNSEFPHNFCTHIIDEQNFDRHNHQFEELLDHDAK